MIPFEKRMTTIYEQSELNYLEQDIQYILDKLNNYISPKKTL